MDKNILKGVIADNQLEVPRYKVILHISVIPTQRFRSYPPSVFTDTWLSFANLLFLSQTLSFNIKTM